MWIEGVGAPFRYTWPGGDIRLAPGVPVQLPEDRALRLLAKAPGKVRVVLAEVAAEAEARPENLPTGQPTGPQPEPPLQPGWLVAYRDAHGRLQGGSLDRPHGTVQECRWTRHGWTVELTDGRLLPLSAIVSVGRTDATGRLTAAWTVSRFGVDGENP